MEKRNMRTKSFRVVRRSFRFSFRQAARKAGHVWTFLVLLVIACATSPSDQLNQAESLLAKLESSGAEAYLKYDLAEARRKLEEARKFIRQNRFDMASQYLNSTCQKLDSCSIAFLEMRQLAQQQCQQQFATLSTEIDHLGSLMTGLPRQSYIDQNRFDIYTHRLRRYREEMDLLQKLITKQDFPTALDRSARLAFQVKQSLTGLISSASIPESMMVRTKPSETSAQRVVESTHTGSR
jgi:exonuclease VII large subunit